MYLGLVVGVVISSLGAVSAAAQEKGASSEGSARDFRRSAISADSRHRATTAGANFDFSGGKVRLTANYASRKVGEPGIRRGTLIAQAQVKF